ncbi:FprA family A-type flavoprotein [Treponema parvum]|uniref:FprA family A-type flavoprotein n=1 Tax=Treponema parvum TaxID=138851 RepID=UPI001AEBBBE0|nr:FprA family A-type flavoprotein [Treponema parvum]QTQ16253.1 FprA family A-type flavoprotein [Treponema parvum]
MKAIKISSGIYSIHADIDDTNDLFEGFWPLPYGVTLNSYIVQGKKTCLIDLFKEWSDSLAQYEEQLISIGVKLEDIDCVVLNHLEPDHTDYLRELRRRNPTVQIISTEKGVAMLQKFFGISENLRAVKTGDTLDLGGRTLTFYETPNVHWPETMMTFDDESGILFSCDGFGSYGSLGEKVFDDEFSVEEHLKFEKECLRYYSNIVASFSPFVKKTVEKLDDLKIKVVAPSHGIIWRTEPKKIIERYLRYAGYNTPVSGQDQGSSLEKEICIVWSSMYGYTKKGLDAVIEGIKEIGVPFSIHQLPQTNFSFVLADALKSAGLVIAMPTYEYKMFPPMAHFIDLCGRKHITGKKVLRIGNWGWVGGAKKEYETSTAALNWEQGAQIEWQGIPSEETLKILKEQGKDLALKIKNS